MLELPTNTISPAGGGEMRSAASNSAIAASQGPPCCPACTGRASRRPATVSAAAIAAVRLRITPPLPGTRLDNRERRLRGNDPRQLEPGAGEQRRELVGGALL